jgi:hypothetical protein
MNDARLKESDKFSAENQDKMFAAHFTKSGPGKWTNWWPSARSQDVQRLNEIWQESKSSAQPTPTPPPAPALPRPQASRPALREIARVPTPTPKIVPLTLPSSSPDPNPPMSMADSGGSNISNIGTGIDYTFASRSGVGIFNA